MKNDLKTLQAKYEELGKEIEKLKSQQYDFSELIGRNGIDLAIKGDMLLKSFADGGFAYIESNREAYKDPLSYTECKLSDLEKGDVFILEEYAKNPKLQNFGIFMGKNKSGYYIGQHLDDNGGIETIAYNNYYSTNYDVIKINRF